MAKHGIVQLKSLMQLRAGGVLRQTRRMPRIRNGVLEEDALNRFRAIACKLWMGVCLERSLGRSRTRDGRPPPDDVKGETAQSVGEDCRPSQIVASSPRLRRMVPPPAWSIFPGCARERDGVPHSRQKDEEADQGCEAEPEDEEQLPPAPEGHDDVEVDDEEDVDMGANETTEVEYPPEEETFHGVGHGRISTLRRRREQR